ncbi:MAG: Ca2+-dependent phosphoinositide-specific phospholipase C, partial [Bacteroidota bacterium]
MKLSSSACFLMLALNVFGQDSLPLNRFRILASHNSYKKFPSQKEMRFLNKIKKQLGSDNNPEMIDYGHATLEDQLTLYGIRGLELDVYADPTGKAFQKRQIGFFARGVKKKSNEPSLKEPGLKILHIKDIDFETHAYTFADALIQLRNWSVKNPNHFPVYVNIELKEDGPGNSSRMLQRLGFKKAPIFDVAAWNELNQTIVQTLADRLLTPLDMKGDFADLHERIDSMGWPTLADSRGKFIFVVEGFNQHTQDLYWKNAIDFPVFGYGNADQKNCIFLLRNDPVGHEEEIATWVRKGYVVRTRADAGTIESRNNSVVRRESAFNSRAQLVSTDYYLPNLNFSEYSVQLPSKTEFE